MERMTTKEEVPEDVVNCASSLMVLNSATPTAEECKSIQLWKNTAALCRLFARVSERIRSSTITASSSTVLESEIIPKTKADKLKAPLVESPSKPIIDRKIGRCLDVGTKERMPFWLFLFMRHNNGVGAKMIIEKSLTATDLNSKNGRLSMPFNQIVDMDFLTEEEETIIDEKSNKLREEGVDATFVDDRLNRWEVNLRRWNMNNSPLYNLVTGWNQVVEDIDLQKNDNIRLWSFHSNGKLYFALVLLPRRATSDSGKSKSGKRNSALVIHEKT